MAVYFDQKETGMIKIDDVKGAMTGAPGEHYMAIQENFIAEKIPIIDISEYTMPLNAVLKSNKINEEELFRKYDRKGDKSMLLSAEEIAAIFKDYMNCVLKPEEVLIIENYFRKTYSRKEIKRAEWKQFLQIKAIFDCDVN